MKRGIPLDQCQQPLMDNGLKLYQVVSPEGMELLSFLIRIEVILDHLTGQEKRGHPEKIILIKICLLTDAICVGQVWKAIATLWLDFA
jgi:hypothetical protein